MATALVDIANNAGGKIGGFGDQLGGDAFVTAAQLLANDDKVSQWINEKWPVIRKKVIVDLASVKSPFRETLKFADLGDDLKQDDLSISTIVSSGGVVTVTTAKVHGRSTADTVFLADIKGTLVTSLNNTTKTITVTSTTAFTLDGVTGTASWVHTADTGIISKVPEIGAWSYAFTLPADMLALVRVTDEVYTARAGVQQEYQNRTILNRDAAGLLLLTNALTNAGGDSSYIEYTVDQATFALFTPVYEECLATMLAYELAPILGKNEKIRQNMLVEYKQVTVPDARRFNSSQYNNYSVIKQDYRGGRSATLPRP